MTICDSSVEPRGDIIYAQDLREYWYVSVLEMMYRSKFMRRFTWYIISRCSGVCTAAELDCVAWGNRLNNLSRVGKPNVEKLLWAGVVYVDYKIMTSESEHYAVPAIMYSKAFTNNDVQWNDIALLINW